jgi:hypothetical protein
MTFPSSNLNLPWQTIHMKSGSCVRQLHHRIVPVIRSGLSTALTKQSIGDEGQRYRQRESDGGYGR